MFIDFNHNATINANNITQKVVEQKAQTVFKSDKDSFTHSVKINNSNSDYDNIKITKKSFGTTSKTNEKVYLYTIKNKNGSSVDLSTFGATITSIKVPDKDGKIKDVTQGYKDVIPYETAPVGHAGGTIGPCANKIDNGKFVINNKEYNLECNKDNGTTHCHGGSEGLDVKNWKAKELKDGVEFTYVKKDMENSYPANVEMKVTYKFDNNNNLHIIYNAKSDNDTLLNLTNHTYFNLDGAENTSENAVYNHYVKLPNSSKITENNSKAIPTGKLLEVSGTPFDFSKTQRIGDVINSENEQIQIGSGFDHNYCVDNYDGKTLINVAEVYSPQTGIKLDVKTNLPGFQFYTANHLGKTTQPAGKDGSRYEKRSSFCIEPQFYPNAINTPEFEEKGILKAGEEYNREIQYSFSVE